VLQRSDALEDEGGFTIIEVMVSIVILLLGVLGAVTMIDTANGLTSNNTGREGALNLSREIEEAARMTDYDSLNGSGAATALQGNAGLGDADTTTAGWQVIRRGIKYTVGVTACVYDSPKDGARSSADTGTGYCANAAQALSTSGNSNCAAKPVTPCIDTNPDDFRQLDITSSWTRNGKTRSSTQSALIVNPSGGRGPRITNVTVSPTLTSSTVGPSTGSILTYTVTTSSLASSVEWSSSDGTSKGQGTSIGSNKWTFTYDLGTPGATGSVLDGNYTLSIQAFSAAGVAGDLNAQDLVVNRSAPFDVRSFAGGRNDRDGQIVDFSWIRNSETDIVGYRVYWVRGAADWNSPPAGDQPDVLVCGNSQPLNATSCFDPSPQNGAQSYYVKAVDKDTSGNLRESSGPATPLITTAAAASPQPTWPAGTALTGATTGGVPSLSWNNAAVPSGTNTILFYRIYRDPNSVTNPAYSERYDTNGGPGLTYADQNFGGSTSHTYVVTAVDNTYEESAPLNFVTTP
jgi:hypothetical protein